MNTKKITIIAIFIFVVIYADSAVAQQWTPLVRIPGLPATGPVNLSMYLVGIYNFLLSIVGIVAVMMLIVGGMRYITATGNSAAIGDAKDIIQNAIVGLLLALLSWVFIATINPDVLYIKKPGGQTLTGYNPKCTISAFDNDPCVCIDGTNTPRVALGYLTCDEACRGEDKCILSTVSCIAGNTNNSGDANGNCVCVDGTTIPLGASATCQEACEVGNCLVADFRIGIMDQNDDRLVEYGFGPAADMARAIDYALSDTSFSYPLPFPDNCSIAVNAADYTILPPGITVTSYEMNFWADNNYFVFGLTPGYEGPLACNIRPWVALKADYDAGLNECVYQSGERSLTCPLNLRVTYSNLEIRSRAQFYKVYQPD